jgi:acetate kinase
MGMASSLILIANPGSASRKYALYDGDRERGQLHFEYVEGRVLCTLHAHGEQHVVHLNMHDLGATAAEVTRILKENDLLHDKEHIARVGLRIVAPSSFFLEDHVVTDEVVTALEALIPRAPIHITATLEELHMLRRQFKDAIIVGVSDSAFHITKPDYAWNYGISLDDADRFEIKRFGYHGLSAVASVHALSEAQKLPPKLVICHLGSGASVTAVHGGKSIDNTMGYSPLEGVVMSTRSGSVDPTAVRALKEVFNWNDNQVDNYLNNHSGLLGLGGSADIRELLAREAHDDSRARLALATYVYSVQKAVGQMSAALGGLDALVFTGTVGERSAAVRERIIARLHYLDLIADEHTNPACIAPEKLTIISRIAHSKPIYVIPTAEAAEIARHVAAYQA